MRALMRVALTAAVWFLGVAMAAWLLAGWALSAKASDVHSLNRLIDETNFIVGDGCSGTLISIAYKLILTNHHCVGNLIKIVEREEVAADGTVKKVRRERRERVTVTQQAYKGHEQVGSASHVTEILAYRKNRDIALLQIIGDRVPATLFAPLLPDDEPILRGETVFVVGNPRMLDATVTSGIISSMTRTFRLPWADNEDVPMIQVSAPAHPGNSGGALYNAKGYLIGIPAAGYGGTETLSLAIPVAQVKEVLRDNCLASIFDERADDEACKAEKTIKGDKDTSDGGSETEVVPERHEGGAGIQPLRLSRWQAWLGKPVRQRD